MTGCLARVSRYMAPTVYPEVPDGGWGWVVAAAFFFVEVFTYGIIKSFGIFLPDLMEQFGESNSRVSWIISICIFVMTFTAPLASATSSRFGHRPVVLCGGFLVSLGTITTAFTNSVNEMYITMGIVSGLGYCLTFLPTVTILSLYFSRRRSLVTAVASTGESFCMFAFAPGLQSLSTSCPNLSSEPEMTEEKPPPTEEQVPLRQVEEQPSTPAPKPQLLDFSVLRDGGFICYAMFGLFATLGFFAPQLYIIPLSVSRGVAASRAACMLSIIAVAEVFGRLSVGWAMGLAPVRKLHVLLGCVVLLAVVLAVKDFSTMPCSPSTGYLVDRTKNYGSAFYSCAVGMGLGALFLGFVLPAKRAACCKSQTGAPGNAREADVTHEDTPVDFMEVDLVPDSPAGVTA
ncbi:monocarboxylate transporter 7-like [Scleropages formosus]|uniref:Monocarboxylate transporter 7-like n=1 Tax=Scleropages formosus TaxID=113540 RepID=A0A0P7VDL5_SCLFO|nr:monocarboxylate transporter 7-like [Scleropages formosus]